MERGPKFFIAEFDGIAQFHRSNFVPKNRSSMTSKTFSNYSFNLSNAI